MLVSARGRRPTGTRARARRAVQRRGRRGVNRGSTPAGEWQRNLDAFQAQARVTLTSVT